MALAATAVHKQLDASSSGREEAFRATLNSQWALLVSQQEAEGEARHSSLSSRREGSSSGDDGGMEKGTSGNTGSSTRSPFLVCGDRHPDTILALESVAHRARTQLAYSRGDTACLLAGLRLDEVETVRELEGVYAAEPLPQPAKLSRSLHAKLDGPLESTAGGVKGDGRETQQGQQRQQGGAPRTIRFNHGEGLPEDLDVSLTPGTWGLDIVRGWTEHLAGFGSTSLLWEEHLRDQFLWTRRPAANTDEAAPAAAAAAAAAGQSGAKVEGDKGKERRRLANVGARPSASVARNALLAEHGLEDLEALWNQTAGRSDEDGACDFRRLRASPLASEPTPQENGTGPDSQGLGGISMNPRRRQEGKRRGGRPGPSLRDPSSSSGAGGDGHDRVVLRGAGSLGKSPGDDGHCLLTVLAYLATRPEVAYLDELPPVFELNVEAAWITQSGEETTYSTWNQGIDGRTEVRDAALPSNGGAKAILEFSAIFFVKFYRVCLPWTCGLLFRHTL